MVALIVAVISFGGLVVAGCDDTSSDPHRQDRIDIATIVLTRVVEHPSFNTEPAVVYVKPLTTEQTFGLDHQAAVVNAMTDVAEVVFVDDDAQALADDQVRGGGAFVALGLVAFDGNRATVRYDEISPGRRPVEWTAVLTKVRDAWVFSEAPTRAR